VCPFVARAAADARRRALGKYGTATWHQGFQVARVIFRYTDESDEHQCCHNHY
jgi:hypothetical protein